MRRSKQIEKAISDAKALIRDELVGHVEGSGKIVIQWKCGRCKHDGLVVVSEVASIERIGNQIEADHNKAYPTCEGLG